MNSQPEGARPALLELKGARIVNAAEPPANISLQEHTIKTWTGDDRIKARALYAKKADSFEPEAIFVL